jgi:pSer/pThr/pTyr-binding forkhead associated (FHA) protein
MIYKLILQNQVDGLKTTHWTFKPPVTVGREPSSGVCIDHDSISRSHCQFMLNIEEALVIKDLESMNGTYVDDERVHQAVLMPGQFIQIGALRLKIEFSTEDEHAKLQSAKPQGSLYATQPMKTLRPPAAVVPASPVQKSWWQRIFGD